MAALAPDLVFKALADPTRREILSLLRSGGTTVGAFIRNAVHDLVTVHHGHMPEIEITSPTQARGLWAMEDILKWPEGAAVKTLHGYGHYHNAVLERVRRKTQPFSHYCCQYCGWSSPKVASRAPTSSAALPSMLECA